MENIRHLRVTEIGFSRTVKTMRGRPILIRRLLSSRTDCPILVSVNDYAVVKGDKGSGGTSGSTSVSGSDAKHSLANRR